VQSTLLKKQDFVAFIETSVLTKTENQTYFKAIAGNLRKTIFKKFKIIVYLLKKHCLLFFKVFLLKKNIIVLL